ncbi:hypothetical protein ES703_57067 [subsurface metagenome]
MNMPIRGTDLGTSRAATTNTNMGKSISSSLETWRSWGFITIARSFLVVSALIIGGWRIGTSAI